MPNHGMSRQRRERKRRQLRKRDGNHCQDCLRPFTLDLPATIEHRVPRRDGGTNDLSNLELLCLPCNVERARKAA
jgi:5-methylcytosine-specific restriction protein A